MNHVLMYLLTRLLQVCFFYNVCCKRGGDKLPSSSISGSVPSRDEISVIFVRIFFRHTHISHVVPLHTLVNSIWRTQTGSSYKLVMGREERRYKRDVSGYDAVFGHAPMPHPLPPVLTSSAFGEQHQVQTGSRNNPKLEVLITQQRKQISTQSQWLYLCFKEEVFQRCTYQPRPMLPSPRNSRWRTDTGSSYNFATENDINVISAAAAVF